MPVTALDPTTALIVVDLQAGSAAGPSAHRFGDVVANAAALAGAFRAAGKLVVLVTAAGIAPGRTEHPIDLDQLPDGWSELVPELDRQPDDAAVTKYGWDAFHGTGLAAMLHERGITQVVVVGHATSFGVESTARSAHALGFHVTLPIDAMTDFDGAGHEHAVNSIFPMLGETARTGDVLALLAR